MINTRGTWSIFQDSIHDSICHVHWAGILMELRCLNFCHQKNVRQTDGRTDRPSNRVTSTWLKTVSGKGGGAGNSALVTSLQCLLSDLSHFRNHLELAERSQRSNTTSRWSEMRPQVWRKSDLRCRISSTQLFENGTALQSTTSSGEKND